MPGGIVILYFFFIVLSLTFDNGLFAIYSGILGDAEHAVAHNVKQHIVNTNSDRVREA